MDTTAHVSLDLATPESVVAALDEHVDMWSHAEVVAIGWTARTVHELHVVAHGLVRLLVGRLGFTTDSHTSTSSLGLVASAVTR